MTCEKLHDIVRRGVRYSYDTTNSKLVVASSEGSALNDDYVPEIPKNGVYIMFENGELHNDGKERIVRIGINEQPDRLPNRIMTHYTGTTRRSIFRKHIGTALSNKLGSSATEEQISEYIQNNISFVVIEVKDKEQREQLEKMLVGTVASCDSCMSSDNWLGKYCDAPKIKHGKLWNVTFLEEQQLTKEYAQLIFDGLVLSCDISQSFKEFLRD
ncbi:MAG: hypothetical protein J1F18_10800 [Lachnospiraceae bacterium]|nr:hypothetical protein [Lachnospiraceae bacterium]